MALLRIAILFFVSAASVAAVEIRFVPAMPEGTVSLGIYDSSDNLVRLLCDEWPIANFKSGLDGLSTEWDGKDAGGRPVPAGTYRARGFAIGNVGIEGEAFHFNDWISSGESPRVVSIGAVAVLPGGDLLLAARLAGGKGALLRYSPGSPNPWQTLAAEAIPDDAGKTSLAVAAGRAFVLTDNKVRAVDLSGGKEIPVPPIAAGTVDLSARDDRLLVLGQNSLRILGAADFSPRSEFSLPGAGAVSAALLEGNSAVVAGKDGSLWHGGENWKKIEVPDGTKVRAVAAGRAATFWALQQINDGPAMVVQYSPEEGRLSEWTSSAGGAPSGLGASTEEDYFCAIFRGPDSERTVAIRRAAGNGWKFVADKTITDCTAFGSADGKLSPVSQDVPSETTLGLAQNPLDPAAPRTIAVRAAALPGGTGLMTTDGLPLVRVSDDPGFARLMILPGSRPGMVQFFQGDGACVEQYALTNLGDMAAFDAGTIEMEDGAEKPAPPAEEPADPKP